MNPPSQKRNSATINSFNARFFSLRTPPPNLRNTDTTAAHVIACPFFLVSSISETQILSCYLPVIVLWPPWSSQNHKTDQFCFLWEKTFQGLLFRFGADRAPHRISPSTVCLKSLYRSTNKCRYVFLWDLRDPAIMYRLRVLFNGKEFENHIDPNSCHTPFSLLLLVPFQETDIGCNPPTLT